MDDKDKRELIAQYVAQKKSARPADENITPLAAREFAPLSFGQERLWFLYQLEKDNPSYNRPLILRLRGKLNLQVFQDSIQRILERHGALRVTFPIISGEPVAKTKNKIL